GDEVNDSHRGAGMRTLIGLLAAVALAAPGRAGALQWGLSAEVGVARFAGTAQDSSGATLGPYRPTTFAVRVDRDLGPVRVGLGRGWTDARRGVGACRSGCAIGCSSVTKRRPGGHGRGSATRLASRRLASRTRGWSAGSASRQRSANLP